MKILTFFSNIKKYEFNFDERLFFGANFDQYIKFVGKYLTKNLKTSYLLVRIYKCENAKP